MNTPAWMDRGARRVGRMIRVGAMLVVASLGGASGSARGDALDDVLATEIRKRHLPGISVAVVRDGTVVRTATGGLANVELSVPVTARTVFQIQSITKTFTATAILLLAEAGRLGLDDPVSKHLAGVPESWSGVTVRHLLSHTSGIKDFINEPTASLRLEVTEEEVLRATAGRPLNFAPGERYAYSNTNYHLLAMIIRRLTGKSYGEFLAERIFGPLGMVDTRVFSRSQVLPGRASGYFSAGQGYSNGEFVAESILAYGGGGILSTAPDMALWAQAMLGGKVLKAESLAAAWTPARLADGKTAGYGLGWGIGGVDGHREISHNGGHATGFTSSLVLYPEDHLGVIVLLNLGGADPGRIARKIAGLYVPALVPRPAPALRDPEPEIARILRDCIERIPEWRLEEKRFGPDLWKLIVAQKEEIQGEVRVLGAFRNQELLSRHREDGASTSRFRVVFERGTILVTMSLDRDGRITGLDSEAED